MQQVTEELKISREITLAIPDELDGERLDRAVAECVPELSRSYVQKLIKSGLITRKARKDKPSAAVKSGDEVLVLVPEPEALDAKPEDIPLNIIFEDNDIVVVDKPPYMPVHPSYGHAGGTLVNALLFHIKNLSSINGVLRPGIVHRLDMNTSGLVLVAKNDRAHNGLTAGFKERAIEKEYLAVVHRPLHKSEFVIDGRIGRSAKNRLKMAIRRDEGRDATTLVRLAENIGDFAAVAAFPKTGRTHQIRVHLASAGHPIVADGSYGRETRLVINGKAVIDRQALHARRIKFKHPATAAPMEFESPLPEDIVALLQALHALAREKAAKKK